MQKYVIALLVALLVLLLAPLALAIPSPFEDLSGFTGGLLAGIHDSNWRVVGAFIIMGLVALWRRFAPVRLSSGKAAWVASLVIGAAVGLADVWAAGGSLGGVVGTVNVLINGAITGLVASGLYSGGKKLSEKKEPVEE